MNRYLRYSISILSIIALTACGSKDDPPEIKILPENFSLVFPSNNSICQAGDLIADQPDKLGITMKWEKSNNATLYRLSITDLATGFEEVKLETNNNIAEVVLTKATLYQWKITATNKNGQNESTLWSFYTEGEGIGNHVPYPAYDFRFSIETMAMLTVDWKASDEDNDLLLYDVTVFENDTVLEVFTDLVDKQVSNMAITLGSTYYLTVTVKDGVSETTTTSPAFTYN